MGYPLSAVKKNNNLFMPDMFTARFSRGAEDAEPQNADVGSAISVPRESEANGR